MDKINDESANMADRCYAVKRQKAMAIDKWTTKVDKSTGRSLIWNKGRNLIKRISNGKCTHTHTKTKRQL